MLLGELVVCVWSCLCVICGWMCVVVFLELHCVLILVVEIGRWGWVVCIFCFLIFSFENCCLDVWMFLLMVWSADFVCDVFVCWFGFG